jgi:hypothetical protein
VENLKNAELGRQRGAAARRAKAASRTADLLPLLAAAKARGVKLDGPVENLKNAELGVTGELRHGGRRRHLAPPTCFR